MLSLPWLFVIWRRPHARKPLQPLDLSGSLSEGSNDPSCTDANVFNMWGIPETHRQWSSQRLPLPCLLIALASGGCRGGSQVEGWLAPPDRDRWDPTWSGPDRTDPPVNVQVVQAKTNTPVFVPNGGTPCTIHSFSASCCVETLYFSYVYFTFLSIILISRSSFQFYANTSVQQMCVADWADKQLLRFCSLCLHVSSHLLSDLLMSMKWTSV